MKCDHVRVRRCETPVVSLSRSNAPTDNAYIEIGLWAQEATDQESMTGDHEESRNSPDFQARAVQCPVVEMNGYQQWSTQKLTQPGNEAIISQMDGMSLWMLPEDVAGISEATFESIYSDLKS